MNGRNRRVAARVRVFRCADAVRDPELPIDSIAGAFAELELACRDLVNAVDDLPSRERPEGWALDPDGGDGMTRICFIDTETTSLRPDRRAWEVGAIVREPGGTETEHHWFVNAADLDLGNADLMALKVGRFHDRHPEPVFPDRTVPDAREFLVMREVEAVTRGAHLVGAVVSFDAEVLANRMRAHGICPSWHYHLIDVEALAAGWLNGFSRTQQAAENRNHMTELARPPWKSDDLSEALGVRVSDGERHTALGDARWAMRIYDAAMGRPS